LNEQSVAAQEKIKFPVGVGTKTIGTNMFWLATKKGFFDEFGWEYYTSNRIWHPKAEINLEGLRFTAGLRRTAQRTAAGSAEVH